MQRNLRLIFALILALMLALLLAPAGSQARVTSSTPITLDGASFRPFADPDGNFEDCGNPSDAITTPIFDHSSITYGTTYWVHLGWHTTCEGSLGFVFRRVTLRGSIYDAINTSGPFTYYWIAHDGSKTTSGCFYNEVDGKGGITCANNTEINGGISATNPGDLYVQAQRLFTGPCNVGTAWNGSTRYHYSPYVIKAQSVAYLAMNCP